MAKVISLSEKAYERLKSMKKPGESFSDVVVRVSEKNQKNRYLNLLVLGRAMT
jgi:predicted CopG family antitoxin